VSNLYRRSGLSRVGCSLLLSSPALSLFHRCSLSFAVVIQFGGPSIVLTLVYYLWGRIVLRNCIADEAKNRAVSSGFSGATEPDFALFVGPRAVTAEGTESVQERGSRHAISTPIFCARTLLL
jgi:hypothetical protein